MLKLIKGKITSITPINDQPGWDSVVVDYIDSGNSIIESTAYQVQQTSESRSKFRSMVIAKCEAHCAGHFDEEDFEVNAEIKVRRSHGAIDTVLNGVATFHLTEDGTTNSPALFEEIFSIVVAAENNTSTPNSVPICSVKSISPDMKTIIVNAIRHKSGDQDMEFAPDGTKVHIIVYGK